MKKELLATLLVGMVSLHAAAIGGYGPGRFRHGGYSDLYYPSDPCHTPGFAFERSPLMRFEEVPDGPAPKIIRVNGEIYEKKADEDTYKKKVDDKSLNDSQKPEFWFSTSSIMVKSPQGGYFCPAHYRSILSYLDDTYSAKNLQSSTNQAPEKLYRRYVSGHLLCDGEWVEEKQANGVTIEVRKEYLYKKTWVRTPGGSIYYEAYEMIKPSETNKTLVATAKRIQKLPQDQNVRQ